MARMILGHGTIDDAVTGKLRAIKRLPARNDGTLNSAILSAAYYAKKMNETMFVYQGNSNMHRVYRVSSKPGEYLNPINNDGDQVLSVSPDLTVARHDVRRDGVSEMRAPGSMRERSVRAAQRPPVSDLHRFADWVNREIYVPGDLEMLGDDKIFISSLYDDSGISDEMSLTEFKRQLVAAHRDGLVVLSRADLVSAMDPKLVQRSEISHHGAEYHFININQTNAAFRRAAGLPEKRRVREVKMPRGSNDTDLKSFEEILDKGVILVAGESQGYIDPFAENVHVAIVFNVTGYGPHTAAIYAYQNRLTGNEEEALQEAHELLEDWEREKYPLPPDEEEHRTETYDGRTWTLPAQKFCDAIYGTGAEKFIDVLEDEDEESEADEDDDTDD